MFDVQPVGVVGQLPGQGIDQLRSKAMATIVGMNVELVDYVIGSLTAALSHTDSGETVLRRGPLPMLVIIAIPTAEYKAVWFPDQSAQAEKTMLEI